MQLKFFGFIYTQREVYPREKLKLFHDKCTISNFFQYGFYAQPYHTIFNYKTSYLPRKTQREGFPKKKLRLFGEKWYDNDLSTRRFLYLAVSHDFPLTSLHTYLARLRSQDLVNHSGKIFVCVFEEFNSRHNFLDRYHFVTLPESCRSLQLEILKLLSLTVN